MYNLQDLYCIGTVLAAWDLYETFLAHTFTERNLCDVALAQHTS